MLSGKLLQTRILANGQIAGVSECRFGLVVPEAAPSRESPLEMVSGVWRDASERNQDLD